MAIVNTTRAATKTVVVLGAAYAGRRCAQILSSTLPPDWRLVVIDRNTHFNHVYVFPRFTVIPSHANKAFVPYIHAFEPRRGDPAFGLPTPPSTPTAESEEMKAKMRIWIHGNVSSLNSHSVTLTRLSTTDSDHPVGDTETIDFDYLVYALGASLPSPVDVWGEESSGQQLDGVPMGCKKRGVAYMHQRAETMKRAKSVLVVGGGALGIQLATDLKDVYPEKEVTLIHSRQHLMPLYPIEMHDGIMQSLKELGVKTVLGERVMTWPDHPEILDGNLKTLITSTGRKLTAEMILPCTGQKPHVKLMAAFRPDLISKSTGRIRIHPTLQVDNSLPETEDAEDLSHIFACGDCAESGAIQAGHTAYWQGQQAAQNIVKMIANREVLMAGPLGEYKPTHPAIKVTLGRSNGIISNADGTRVTGEGVEDLSVPVMWESHMVDDLPYDA